VQVIARQLQATDEDIEVLRALGASPATAMGEGLLGILGAIVLGSLLAAGVAIGLSPLSPIGPVRPVYPAPGIEMDVAVLGFGLLALIGGIGAAAVGLACIGLGALVLASAAAALPGRYAARTPTALVLRTE
jgi:hypothetical protein